MKSNKGLFVDWDISAEMKEALELDLTVEFLSGKSKLTNQFQNARKIAMNIPDENVEDEDENKDME